MKEKIKQVISLIIWLILLACIFWVPECGIIVAGVALIRFVYRKIKHMKIAVFQIKRKW